MGFLHFSFKQCTFHSFLLMFLEIGRFRNETLEGKVCCRIRQLLRQMALSYEKHEIVHRGVSMDRDGELVLELRVRRAGWAEGC